MLKSAMQPIAAASAAAEIGDRVKVAATPNSPVSCTIATRMKRGRAASPTGGEHHVRRKVAPRAAAEDTGRSLTGRKDGDQSAHNQPSDGGRQVSGVRRVFVTGIAGFVGFHLTRLCLGRGWGVAGVDSLSPYYSPNLKRARLSELARNGCSDVTVEDLAQPGTAARRFAAFAPDTVFHLAAQPGARVIDVAAVERDNIRAFDEVLSAINAIPGISHFFFASSSSVYGGTKSRSFREDAALSPVGLYAASKAANEARAASSAQSDGPPTTARRLFSAYGPWGRLDMAMFKFADALASDQPVTLHNGGHSMRTMLFVDDAVRACAALANVPPDESEDRFRAVNIAGPEPVRTAGVLRTIALNTGKAPRVVSAETEESTENPAGLSRLRTLTGEVPQAAFADGVRAFLRCPGMAVSDGGMMGNDHPMESTPAARPQGCCPSARARSVAGQHLAEGEKFTSGMRDQTQRPVTSRPLS